MKGKKRYYRGIYQARKLVVVHADMTQEERLDVLCSTEPASWTKKPEGDFLMIPGPGDGWKRNHLRSFIKTESDPKIEARARTAVSRVGKMVLKSKLPDHD